MILKSLRRWQLGTQLTLPEVEFVEESAGTVRLILGEIPALREVVTEIVEFVATVVVELDELSVAIADGSARSPG